MLRRTFCRFGGHGHGHKVEQKLYVPNPKYADFHRQNEIRQKLVEETYGPSPTGRISHNRGCAIVGLLGVSTAIAYKWMFVWTIRGSQI